MDQRRASEDSLEVIYDVLKEVELEEYFPRIRDDLNLTRLAHFEHVKVQDLTQIGLARPAARRLLSAIKQRKAKLQPNLLNNFLDVLNPKSCGNRGARKATNREDPLYAKVQREAAVSCLISSKDLVLKEKLGQGSFGEVLKAEWKRDDGRVILVAVKMLRSDALALPGAFGDFVKEVNAMIGLNHPNLIKLHGVSLSSPYMIVQELAALGSVLDRLRKECSLTSVAVILEWSKQICLGMAYLERQRWIHRDLAARNVLLSALNKIKIGDFGLMKSIQNDDDCYVMTEHKKIPFPWCAPECLKLRKFSHASDCWAYAVTLWELFTFGEHPWAGNNGAQILQLIDQEGKRLPKPPACPPEIYSIMLNCWAHREHDRPTFVALNEFLQNVHMGVVKATKAFDEPDRLQLNEGDDIVVIDGQPENHWWTGQNKRTLRIGAFPRISTKEVRSAGWKASSHISKPLRNSFIHTGHGDTSPGKSFGSPAKIDDIFLRNPVPPVDLLAPAPANNENTLPKPPKAVKDGANAIVHSEDVLLDLMNHETIVLPPAQPEYGNDFLQPPEVDYFNVPPGFSANSANNTPSAPGYHYYTPPVAAVPDRPVSYGNVLNPPNPGMLYSNVVIPTVSPAYSPNTYYNTASFIVRPAPAPPVAGKAVTPVVASGLVGKPLGKHEKVIKTYPVPLSIDPFDTSVVGQDLWSDFKEKLPVKDRSDAYRPMGSLGLVEEGKVAGPTGEAADMLFGSFAEERSKQAPARPNSFNAVIGGSPLASSPGWTIPPVTQNAKETVKTSIPPTRALAIVAAPSKPVSKSPVPVFPVTDDSGNSTGSASSRDDIKPPSGMSSVLDDMLRAVQAAVPGHSSKTCEEALRACRFDLDKAVRTLKIGLLLRLSVAGEEDCRRVLEQYDWDVERAGAALLGPA